MSANGMIDAKKFDEMAEEIMHPKNKMVWTAVSDRKPESQFDNYLVMFGKEIVIAQFSKYASKPGSADHVEKDSFYLTDDNGYNYSIFPSHWMPLPEPPQAAQQ
jgi:hypothetical protein